MNTNTNALGSAFRLLSLARLAPLFVCAGVLTSSLPAAAQAQPAPPTEASPEAAPAAAPANPEASPAAAEASPESAPATAPASSAAEPQPDESIETVQDGELPEVVVTGFGQSLSAA